MVATTGDEGEPSEHDEGNELFDDAGPLAEPEERKVIFAAIDSF
jgi:hypothetical protein